MICAVLASPTSLTDKIDFVGMSEDEIEEEQKEFAISLRCDLGVTDVISATNGVSDIDNFLDYGVSIYTNRLSISSKP
jgi:hypothetical protein